MPGGSAGVGGDSASTGAYLATGSWRRPIEAENFDNGGAGVGYSSGTVVRTGNDRDTDIGVQVGGSNGYNVGHTAAGDWLAYTMNAPSTGYTSSVQLSLVPPRASVPCVV